MTALTLPSFKLFFTVAFVAILLGYPHPKLNIDEEILPMLRKYAGRTEHQDDKNDSSTVLDGTVILITGATSGIGLSLSRFVSKYGATVLALGRSEDKLHELQKEYPNNIRPFQVDQSSLQSVSDVVAAIRNSGITKIDIVVNNAGMFAGHKTTEFESKTPGFDEVFVVNYLSHFLLTEKLSDLLDPDKNGNKKGRVPRIVQVSSTYHWGARSVALLPQQADNGTFLPPLASQPGYSFGSQIFYGIQSYSTSKLGQVYHARMLRLKHPILSKIPIVSICPSWVVTELARSSFIKAKLIKALAFPVDGYGIAAALEAMFSSEITVPVSDQNDFITSTNCKDFMWVHDRNPIFGRRTSNIFDFVTEFFAIQFMVIQKFFPHRGPHLTSPSSHNTTIANALYDWSYQAISEYL